MNVRSIAFPALVALAVAAVVFVAYTMLRPVTELQVGHVSGVVPAYPEGAIPYTLALKRFVVSTTIKITGCTDTPPGEEIAAVSTVAISESDEVDPDQRYYLYLQSRSRGKGLDYRVESYDNGTVRSIWAAIRDDVMPTTASLAGALVRFNAISSPPPPPPAAAGQPGPTPSSNCADINAAIAKDADDKRLTIHGETVWTPRAAGQAQLIFSAFPPSLLQAFRLNAPRWKLPQAVLEIAPDVIAGSSPPIDYYAGDSDQKCENEVPPAGLGKPPLDARPCLARGLVVRKPAIATLRYSLCDAECNRSAALTPYPATRKTIAQLGMLMLVPVRNGYAQSSGVDAEFSPDGTITRLQLRSGSAFVAPVPRSP